MILKGGYNYYGIPIGVIALESYFPKPTGHIKYPACFDFTVLYKTVKGATIERLIEERDPELLQPFIDAARELEREGIGAITGSCGFLALHQREIADAVDIPVFISSLIQMPMVCQMMGQHKKVGVVVANKNALTSAHLQAVGIAETAPIVIAGMQDHKQFNAVILQSQGHDFDMDVFWAELSSTVAELIEENPAIGALVLECSDLSHFAPRLHEKFKLPVFDLTSLTRMIAAGAIRQIA